MLKIHATDQRSVCTDKGKQISAMRCAEQKSLISNKNANNRKRSAGPNIEQSTIS